jgi:hypothetical protein
VVDLVAVDLDGVPAEGAAYLPGITSMTGMI